ncbi:hypothetical protein [Actinocrispum wychmicini]|uniref:Uncharacterized protein n=1 Tax=Actinocrispum wychmicini TaxID=1213861 RepID=A0A4R2JVU0_9PSEU|nr:hypothetical protein [Actinocrispum wychmicini]TCO58285.1 hypothetical protein EV192_105350 [Actinocrispum wychmicini]
MRPKPEFRQRVRDLAESQWRVQVTVVHLDEVKPSFTVPGRRKDGTIEGKRLVRRFFWNLFRGTLGAVTNAVLIVAGGGAGNVFSRNGSVTGPPNAQALNLVDAARPAKAAWLVYSESHIAVVDSGNAYTDPKDAEPPRMLWHATKPDLPRHYPRNRRLTWPDGSEYNYYVSFEELDFLNRSRRN